MTILAPADRRAQQIANLSFIVARYRHKENSYGPIEQLTWSSLIKETSRRREGEKDGENLVFTRFAPEPDGRAHRKKVKALARTAIALDIETNKNTGEIPPSMADVAKRVQGQGWAAICYTSHNHTTDAPRYRILLPLSAEIPPHLPAVEAVAEVLDLGGVLDRSKLGPASLFYLPSCKRGESAKHESLSNDGAAIDAAWIQDRAGAVLAAREAEQQRVRQKALAEAETTRKARIAAGYAPSDNLIEKIRDRLDLAEQLLRHGYDKVGDRYLYPGSQTGVPGVHILTGGDGVDRVYSHHAADPLAEGNLPSWCRVAAVDVVDVVTILDFGGDRKAALHKMALQFGIESNPRPTAEPPPEWDDIPPPDEAPQTGARKTTKDRNPRRDDKDADGISWPEPVDFLATETTATPVLGARHVPDAIWPFAVDTAARMGVDPTAVALSALVSCASVITDDWQVQPKRLDYTWTERCCLWGAFVGDPSILKTPVISAATKPIDKLDAEARKQHLDAMRQWRAAEAQAKLDKTVPPPQPKLDRYMVEGTTIEALSEVLRDDDEAKMRAPAKKVLSRHDEMSEFFGGLDRYKSGTKGGSDRGAYLRLYNGGRHTVDRIGRGSFAVPNWSACFLGGIQPGPIQRIARESAEDGLLQRFIYCVPERQGEGLDREPDHAALKRYSALFPALVALQPAAGIGNDQIKPVVFHADAHAHRQDIDALADAMSAMPDTSARLKAAFGKWRGLFARLCLSFHLIDIADRRVRGEQCPPVQVVAEKTARRVATFMREIVLPHLLRAEAVMFSTEQTGHVRWVAGFILSKKSHRITAREIMMSYRALQPPEARRELEAVMFSLVALGWLDPEESSNPAKGCTAWAVNPAVHTQFEARAKAETERRALARERIAEAVARVRSANVPRQAA